MRSIMFALLLTIQPGIAKAIPVGEQQRTIALPSAQARRVDHKPEMAVTVWYPAVAGTMEHEKVIGPPDDPYFRVARVGDDATPENGKHPVILLSHGFGGSAAIMGWLGVAFARAGYIVIAVDHPGNSNGDMTLVGGASWWERPRDMIAAFSAMRKDKLFASRIDANRVGAAGFSLGGMTALALGGAIVSPANFDRYCATNSNDEVCQSPPESGAAPSLTMKKGIKLLGLERAARRAGERTALPGLRAILALAPNSQALSTDSFQRIVIPTVVITGSADATVPASRHAKVAADHVAGARLIIVPGAAHYSFLATCTPMARTHAGPCKGASEQAAAHKTAIDAGLALFSATLGTPTLGDAQSALPQNRFWITHCVENVATDPALGRMFRRQLASYDFDRNSPCRDKSLTKGSLTL